MKQKAIPFTSISLLVIFSAFSQTVFGQKPTDSIHFFTGSAKEAFQIAKAEKKYVFFDAYASWCGPCKTMEKEVYTDSAVANYLNEKFISIKVDMEKGDGPRLAKIFTTIDGYPSILFFDPEGRLCKTILGSRNAEDFLQEAKLVAK